MPFIMSSQPRLSQKEIEEIKKLKAERKATIARLWFDIIKSVVLISGSIIVFLLIKQPESIINKKSSEEAISRERAKLILELLKYDDPDKIIMGLEVIEVSYPKTEGNWFKDLKETYSITSLLKDRKLIFYSEIKRDSLSQELLKLKYQKALGKRLGGEINNIVYDTTNYISQIKDTTNTKHWPMNDSEDPNTRIRIK